MYWEYYWMYSWEQDLFETMTLLLFPVLIILALVYLLSKKKFTLKTQRVVKSVWLTLLVLWVINTTFSVAPYLLGFYVDITGFHRIELSYPDNDPNAVDY